MRRYLAPLPATVSPADVRPLTLARWPNALDVNEVDDDGTRCAAVYFPDDEPANGGAVSGWRSQVAAATPLPPRASAGRRTVMEQLRAKAREVDAGRDTFGPAQLQRIVAALVLDALADDA